MKWIYHGSAVANLKMIEPKMSEHGQAYIYGVLNRNDTLCYCADFKDFFSLTNNGRNLDKEKVKKHYANKTGYIYLLNKSDFDYNKDISHWIANAPVEVCHCEKIEDIFAEMCSVHDFFDVQLERIKNGK